MYKLSQKYGLTVDIYKYYSTHNQWYKFDKHIINIMLNY